MREERLEVFDERRGYVASAPELRQPVVRHAALVERTRSLIRMVSAEGGSDGLACLGRW
jgi:hypothetical protein